jgi:hypothetical protein
MYNYSMRFNWDNQRIIINHWLPCAAGEFINRCLSVSSKMIMIAGIDDIQRQLIDPSDHLFKLDIFRRYQPEQNTWWHDRFLDSRQWLALRPDCRESPEQDGFFFEIMWQDSHMTNRNFYDRFWRPMACEISDRDLGIVMKSHRYVEVQGLKNLMPQAKVTTCLDYDDWKTKSIRMHKVQHSVLQAYDTTDELPDDYPAHRFQIDRMIKDETDFIAQMQLAYKTLHLPDFAAVKDTLVKMRKLYLMWHLDWKTNRR